MKLLPDRGQGNVDDRVVDPDDEKAHAADEKDAHSPPPGRHARLVASHLAVAGLLVGLGVAMFARVWLVGSPTHTILCQCGDPGQSVWFMAWVPYALAHLDNPLFTTRIFAGQGGVNLLANTSYLLPSLLLSPVTALFGPTAAFNLAETLGPFVSGYAMFLACGRLSDRFIPRAAAALSYGSAPILVGSEIYGHLNLVWLFFPPLLFLLLHEVVAGDRLGARRAGVLAGLLLVAQFFTGTETLLITLLAAAAGLAAAALLFPRAARRRVRRLAEALGAAILTAGCLLAYPLAVLLAGPRHVEGTPFAITSLAGDPLGSVALPVGSVHDTSPFLRLGGYYGVAGPNYSYLGIGFLLLIALSLPLLIRRGRHEAGPILLAGALAWLCSLGIFLLPLSPHSKQWWLPWKYLYRLPIFDEVTPQRFALAVAACAALLLCLSLDGWADLAEGLTKAAARRQPSPRRVLAAFVPPALAVSLATAVGVPLALQYTFPLTMHSGGTPRYFETAARTLPATRNVLVYPYPSSGAPEAMYWQASDHLSFPLVGGRAHVPGANGASSDDIDPLTGSTALLSDASFGAGVPAPARRPELRALRASLRRWRVGRIVVVGEGRAPAWAVVSFAESLGRLPRIEEGAAVFLAGTVRRGHLVVLPARTATSCADQPASPAGVRAAVACLGRVKRTGAGGALAPAAAAGSSPPG